MLLSPFQRQSLDTNCMPTLYGHSRKGTLLAFLEHQGSSRTCKNFWEVSSHARLGRRSACMSRVQMAQQVHRTLGGLPVLTGSEGTQSQGHVLSSSPSSPGRAKGQRLTCVWTSSSRSQGSGRHD